MKVINLYFSSCDQIGSISGSSRPFPRPLVPMIMPLMWESWEMWWSVSIHEDTGLELEGSTPNAYRDSGCCRHIDWRSEFRDFVSSRVSADEGRKSNHGFAKLERQFWNRGQNLITLTSMEWRFINANLTFISEYSGPTGLPDDVDWNLSSSGRIINLSASVGFAAGRIRGEVVRERRIERYRGGYTWVWTSTTLLAAIFKAAARFTVICDNQRFLSTYDLALVIDDGFNGQIDIAYNLRKALCPTRVDEGTFSEKSMSTNLWTWVFRDWRVCKLYFTPDYYISRPRTSLGHA